MLVLPASAASLNNSAIQTAITPVSYTHLDVYKRQGLRSMTGTIFSTKEKGVRYLELTEGYINKRAVDANDEVIGYQFVKLGKMMEDIRHGKTPNEAYEKNVGT